MTAIISFKNAVNENPTGPHRIVNIMAILTTTYSTKFVQKNNKIQSFENCDIDNVFLQDMGK